MDLLDTTPSNAPSLRPERWRDCDGKGHDVWLKVAAGQVTFIVRDVYEALRIDPDIFGAEPDRTRPTTERILHCTTWTLERMREILTRFASVLGDRLDLSILDWAADKVDELEQLGLDDIARVSAATPAPITHLGETAQPALQTDVPEIFSVADAAARLSRDPSIDIGQQRLFKLLRDRGWVTRPGAVYEPAPDLVALGYLRVIHRRVLRARDPAWPQIHITPAGLQKLHAVLGGTGSVDLTLIDPALTEDTP